MSLMRGKIIGHDRERLAFQFTMLNGESVVPCQISDAAMDELAGTAGTEKQRETGSVPATGGLSRERSLPSCLHKGRW